MSLPFCECLLVQLRSPEAALFVLYVHLQLISLFEKVMNQITQAELPGRPPFAEETANCVFLSNAEPLVID